MMKRLFAVLLVASSASAAVDVPVQRVANDAIVFDRVAQMSKKNDLPQNLLQRIVSEDIELLRGRHNDGTYEYASYDRFESSRTSESFSVEARADETTKAYEIRGSFAYRIVISLPAHRLLLQKNRRVYIDHVDIEYIPLNGSASKTQSVKIANWFDAGQSHPIDFPEVAKQATVRVAARSDPKTGYGNMDLYLVHAKIVDNADSPYADAVASAKAIQRAIDAYDIPSMRAMATRMHDDLVVKTNVAEAVPVKPVVPPPVPTTTQAPAPSADVYPDLLAIEDLLTGTDAEKREGMEKLHQLVRRLRPR